MNLLIKELTNYKGEKMRFLYFIFSFNFILSFTLENIVVADAYSNDIEFTFINKKDNLELGRNYFWIETVDGGYDIKYYTGQHIAGFQFEFVGFDNINDYKVVNGKIKEIDFSHSLGYNLIVAFSIDNKTLPIGEHVLFELRNHQFLKELDNFSSTAPDNSIKNIDITQIVVSDQRGNSIKIDFICHKKKCLDFQYDQVWPIDYNSGLVTLQLRSSGKNKWVLEYESDIDIAGYQFNVEGAKLKSVSGGSSEKNNFMIQFAGKTVLGFNFDGEIIPAGRGDLLEFEVE
tara:strand:- start:332 stop:1195 length:864 start_codon:yes stop_codon:yes gene_type:complete